MESKWTLKDGYVFCKCGDKTAHVLEPMESGYGAKCDVCGSTVGFTVTIDFGNRAVANG